jgi:hypothetical protein
VRKNITNMYKIGKIVFGSTGHCHAIEKSEAIAMRSRSSWFTRWWTQKRITGNMEGRGGGEVQGVADQKNRRKKG